MKQTPAAQKTARRTRAPHAMFGLLEAARALEARMEAAMAELGLSMAKLGVLKPLAESGQPVTLTELASCQQCVRSNITQLVDRLEADGLVKRVDDPND